MLSLVRRLPFFRIVAIGRLALVARRHLQSLSPVERRRLAELVRHSRSLSPPERDELRRLVSKLEPGVFARAAVDAFSPVGLPGRFGRRR